MHWKYFALMAICVVFSGCAAQHITTTDSALCIHLDYSEMAQEPTQGVTIVRLTMPPGVLQLQNRQHPSFIRSSGYKVVKTNIHVSDLYEEANWINRGDSIEIDWGTGSGGIVISLQPTSASAYTGTATAYTDLSDPKIRYQQFAVAANRVSCSQHGLTIRSSRHRFAAS